MRKLPPILFSMLALWSAGCGDDSARGTTEPTASSTSAVAETTSETTTNENASPDESTAPTSRKFELRYAGKVTTSGKGTRVWLPVAQSSPDQTVKVLKTVPENIDIATESAYGNRIASFTTDTDKVEFEIVYEIERKEVLQDQAANAKSEPVSKKFLQANKNVPLEGDHLSLLGDLEDTSDPLELARQLYLRVDEHVTYDKSKPGYGNGDVHWVCDSRTGNCTDFHSLFIAWSRAKKIPARFEIGFPLPPERRSGKIGGYHCWAKFHTDKQGWVPVDISEADKHPDMKDYYFGNLTENRVALTVGRDLVLEPPQQGAPLNYFVYPYAETDGKPLPKDAFELDFSFRDLE